VQVYLNRNGQQMGPYSVDDVRAYREAGTVLGTDLAWTDGRTDWVPVDEFLQAATPTAGPSAVPEEKTFFTLKRVVIGSVIWFVAMMIVSAGLFWWMWNDAKANRERKERAGKLGSGMGVITAVGWGALWLPWAAKVGKKRRAERLAAQQQKGG